MAIAHTRLGPRGPATNALAVTPDDAAVIEDSIGLYVGGAGNLAVVMADDDGSETVVTFSAVPAGTLLPLSVRKVKAATTATLIVALYG